MNACFGGRRHVVFDRPTADQHKTYSRVLQNQYLSRELQSARNRADLSHVPDGRELLERPPLGTTPQLVAPGTSTAGGADRAAAVVERGDYRAGPAAAQAAMTHEDPPRSAALWRSRRPHNDPKPCSRS